MTVIGRSGCGKTTMLRLINGLTQADEGEIFVDGKNIKEANLIALRRQIGYVIQNKGLFPHMTVEKNITYVPDISGKKNRWENHEMVLKLLEYLDFK